MKHYDQAVGQFEQFVKIFADQQLSGAANASRHDLRVNLRDRGEIEPEAGIGGDQHFDVAAEFPRQYRPLYAAARECRDWRVRRARLTPR